MKYLAVGSFDGIHLAHQELIKRADGVVVIEHSRASITPGFHRALYINKPTFFYLLEHIKSLTPQQFLDRLKDDFPSLEGLVVGYDFAFGKDREGNIDLIKSYFPNSIIVDEIKVDGISVHSKIVRDAILNNDIDLANRLLGRRYKISGYQIRGLGIGSKKLVPTINLNVLQFSLPTGVFAVYAYIDKIKYRAVCFIGKRVTINGEFSIEFHIIDNFKTRDIYSQIDIEFVKYIRSNRKFNSIDDLKDAISKDIEFAKAILV